MKIMNVFIILAGVIFVAILAMLGKKVMSKDKPPSQTGDDTPEPSLLEKILNPVESILPITPQPPSSPITAPPVLPVLQPPLSGIPVAGDNIILLYPYTGAEYDKVTTDLWIKMDSIYLSNDIHTASPAIDIISVGNNLKISKWRDAQWVTVAGTPTKYRI